MYLQIILCLERGKGRLTMTNKERAMILKDAALRSGTPLGVLKSTYNYCDKLEMKINALKIKGE